MFELKTISQAAIPQSLERVERYRLLNEPTVAESICMDILKVDPDNQQAVVMLILALTDQFVENPSLNVARVLELVSKLESEYQRTYYSGIVYERQGKARRKREYPGAGFDAYELLREAMHWFEEAEPIRPEANEDAVIRWNNCARLIESNGLTARPEDETQLSSE